MAVMAPATVKQVKQRQSFSESKYANSMNRSTKQRKSNCRTAFQCSSKLSQAFTLHCTIHNNNALPLQIAIHHTSSQMQMFDQHARSHPSTLFSPDM